MSIGHSAFWNISGLSIVGLLLGILIALVITRNISRSIKQLELFYPGDIRGEVRPATQGS